MVCPRCNKVRRFKDTVERDKKNRKKQWMITSCITCNFHLNIEEHKSQRDVEEDD